MDKGLVTQPNIPLEINLGAVKPIERQVVPEAEGIRRPATP